MLLNYRNLASGDDPGQHLGSSFLVRYRTTRFKFVCLQSLLDFCSQEGFIRDVFINLDCRIDRANIFESICALFSKTAFPVNAPLSAVHLLSLDGLSGILETLAARYRPYLFHFKSLRT